MTDGRQYVVPSPTLEPARTTLFYGLASDGIDPLHLKDVIDTVHSLCCSGMPGDRIVGISLESGELKITIA